MIDADNEASGGAEFARRRYNSLAPYKMSAKQCILVRNVLQCTVLHPCRHAVSELLRRPSSEKASRRTYLASLDARACLSKIMTPTRRLNPTDYRSAGDLELLNTRGTGQNLCGGGAAAANLVNSPHPPKLLLIDDRCTSTGARQVLASFVHKCKENNRVTQKKATEHRNKPADGSMSDDSKLRSGALHKSLLATDRGSIRDRLLHKPNNSRFA
ncbi:hypothetical protein FISHEDRAFT_60026 [Fistulina hepatica ATCC 64428]|uniref:Uncharacterized protein n=1 Tax=Fistulina hepatica ATCC 64428 TaxID=1128425 RepID=A0A0D7A799_9AGAR|nr:hypothetical protein FISHEDRAFT_60026 [Fistulina hepatica ATCC 64428]